MAYHKHHTKGIVLGGVAVKEGDRLLYIFTREFGLIRALARSVRTERSKLRPQLQDFTVGTVSLIRGKEFWRVASMSGSASFYHALKGRDSARSVLFRLSGLLKRLLPGEEKNTEAYDIFIRGIAALTNPARTDSEYAMIETLTAARLLAILGHLSKQPYEALLSGADISEPVLKSTADVQKSMVQAVNHALRESGL